MYDVFGSTASDTLISYAKAFFLSIQIKRFTHLFFFHIAFKAKASVKQMEKPLVSHGDQSHSISNLYGMPISN